MGQLNLADIEISEDLVIVGLSCTSSEEVISELAKRLERLGKVRPTYLDAVLQRERQMPTGLATKLGGVAIPHTDTEHIKQSAIAVAVLQDPVPFKNMAAPTDDVLVDLVFLLAIAEPKAVTPVLARLGAVLQDPIQLEHIRNQAQPVELVQLLRRFLVDSGADPLSA